MRLVRHFFALSLVLGFFCLSTFWSQSAPKRTQSLPAKSKAAGTSTAASKSAVLPNIILITLDTTRADRMDFLGSQRGLTKNLDSLATDGAVFTRAFSHVP